MAAGLCRGGSPLERTERRAREESESGRGESETGADEGEDGVERGEGWAGTDGLLYAEWDAVCHVTVWVLDRSMRNMLLGQYLKCAAT